MHRVLRRCLSYDLISVTGEAAPSSDMKFHYDTTSNYWCTYSLGSVEVHPVLALFCWEFGIAVPKLPGANRMLHPVALLAHFQFWHPIVGGEVAQPPCAAHTAMLRTIIPLFAQTTMYISMKSSYEHTKAGYAL
jgi:hypothetical protein